jgi:sulfur relay (sulfurtransferase) complex TusBCD TusD component (DsrE family)
MLHDVPSAGTLPIKDKEADMQKEIVMFLSTTPYSFENTRTIFKLAESALKKGHRARLIASGDGVFSIVKGQVPQALSTLVDLVGKGLKVDI